MKYEQFLRSDQPRFRPPDDCRPAPRREPLSASAAERADEAEDERIMREIADEHIDGSQPK